jgi:hypothetical protein
MRALRHWIGRLVGYAIALTLMMVPLSATALEAPVLTPQNVSEHVWFFRGASGVASASNRGYIANAGFVVTGDGVVVFDALGSPVLGDAMIAAIRKVTKEPIRRPTITQTTSMGRRASRR